MRHNVLIDERTFWTWIAKDSGDCWNWTGKRDSHGYGVLAPRPGREQKAHRQAYRMVKGPIPAGLVLDHICRNPRCVNPDHLEAVTNQENTLRGARAVRVGQPTCAHGHEANERNTHVMRVGVSVLRQCRVCNRAAAARCRARRTVG